MDTSNYERLMRYLQPLSIAQDWDAMRSEWELKGIYRSEESQACPCGHDHIREICVLENRLTKRRAEVGNVCVKRFKGIDNTLIFDGVRRIIGDSSKGLNDAASQYFYEKGIISQWEYKFSTDTNRLRSGMTAPRMAKRLAINQKVIEAFARRP